MVKWHRPLRLTPANSPRDHPKASVMGTMNTERTATDIRARRRLVLAAMAKTSPSHSKRDTSRCAQDGETRHHIAAT